MDAGRKQVGDVVGLSSSDEKSGRRILVNRGENRQEALTGPSKIVK